MTTTAPQATPSDTLAAACASTRLQPYRFVHKALRTLLAQALQRAGALDAADALERAVLVDEIERTLALCADHLAHENRFLIEPLQARAPRAAMANHDEHLDHLDAIAALRLLLQRVRDAEATQAAALAYELYLRMSQFVAENLAHMAEEESTVTAALWAHFSDAELEALIDALHASLAPDEMEFFLRAMAGSLNGGELAQLIAEQRRKLPAPAFDAVAGVLCDAFDLARRSHLSVALGLLPA